MNWSLVQIGRSDDGTPSLPFVCDLLDSDAQAYLDAQIALRQFERTRRLIELVHINEADVARLEDELVATAEHVTRSHAPERTTLVHALDAAIVNYLAATRLFLDHRRTHLSRCYGSESAQLEAFDQARKQQYDSSGAYRFVYKLRNYVQHCGMPLQVARTNYQIVEVDGQEVTQYDFLFGCNRDELLSEYQEWSGALDYLKLQPAQFAILPLLKEVTGLLRTIDRAAIAAEGPELWRQAARLLNAIADVCDDEHTGAIGRMTRIDSPPPVSSVSEGYEAQLSEPPVGLLRQLGLVEKLSAHPGWRIRRDRLEAGITPTFV